MSTCRDSKPRIFCAVLFLFAMRALGGEPLDGPSQRAGGLERRIPWTGSRFAGSPDAPPPYRVQLAFPKLKFRQPLALTSAPGSDRLFLAEQAGRIFSFANDPHVEHADLMIDLKRHHPTLSAIYGLAFHPDFQRNRQVYICYVVGGEAQNDGTRVSRFRVPPDDPPRIDADSEQLVLTWLAGGHNGGCLKFGPDGYLYISTGDAAAPSPPDPLNAGQNIGNLLSAILRIDVDRAGDGQPYRIPSDNPFVDLANARGEIWSYGFRNPWKMSFDRVSGDLWVGDVGWELWEMVYRVQKGGNYGWSIMEGRQPVRPEDPPGPTPILPPTIDHPHSEAASITGGFVYRGKRLPQLYGAYVYGDFQSGIIWGLRLEGDRVVWHQELAQTPLQLVAFGEDNAGELYLVDYRQQVFQLMTNAEPDTSRDFPRKLSDTGLFAVVQDQVPAPGVLPYDINAEAWADYVRAQRWLAVPGTESITVDPQGRWQLPNGTVIAKTLELEMERGEAGSRRRLETQILHREADRWRPYTYIWNEQQTDAELADANGSVRTFHVVDSQAAGGIRQQEHRFSGRKECVLCHNPWIEGSTMFGVQSASPLAVRSNQLDRLVRYGQVSANQLRTFERIGLLKSTNAPSTAPLANPYDTSADLDARARAYLDVNCAHCHQRNAGGTAKILLSATVPLHETHTIDERPTQGTFGISDVKIIAPGDPFGSVLYYRISKLGGGRMPRVGSQEVDSQGVALIYDWIRQLDPSRATSVAEHADLIRIARDRDASAGRLTAIEGLAASTRGALALMRLLDDPNVDPSTRAEIIEHVRHNTSGEVRDLFERFVPAAQRTQRLGAVVDADELLALEADAERGRRLFEGNSIACKTCHRIQNIGEQFGPDLTQISRKYDRRQLLQHILEPSRFIDPVYVPYVAETAAGQVFTGLLEQQTPDEIVLRDANNQPHRLPLREVEVLARQQKSLMPELLLRDMTPQQVADLLAYLATLK